MSQNGRTYLSSSYLQLEYARAQQLISHSWPHVWERGLLSLKPVGNESIVVEKDEAPVLHCICGALSTHKVFTEPECDKCQDARLLARREARKYVGAM